MSDISKLRVIDWRLLDDINKDIDHLNQVKQDPESPFGPSGPLPVDLGQVLQLTVKVTDPELAQIVLNRSFVSDEGSRIPGMAITEITVDPDGRQRKTLADQLRVLADKLEANASMDHLEKDSYG